ncbi:MAG: NUDIX hydrolase N-terminal domain-containing protein [Bacilli bacterium]|nr:NUDIX hydrolase N-terminal domain-containing protein [Bacilli bacterium]
MDTNEIYDYILRMQAIAKIGLTYSKDPYALTNYQEINDLSKEFLEKFMSIKLDRPNYFEKDIYPTPNISVRVMIFNEDKSKILMVREVNSGLYSLPGGWADVYDSPSQTAINESKQEAGIDIKINRLVGVCDRRPFKNPASFPDYVILFEATQVGEFKEHEYETDDVNYFDVNNLPPISKKTSKEELTRFIKAAINNETIYD